MNARTTTGPSRNPIQVRCLVGIATAIGIAASASPAAAAWTAPVDVSSSLAADPYVATDPDGDSVLTWDKPTFGDVEARTISAAGTLGPVLVIDDSAANAGRVAIDAQGDAVFAWRSDGDIFTRRLTAAGTLGALQAVSATSDAQSAGPPEVATDMSGDTVFAWVNVNTRRVQARTMSDRGRLGPIRNVSPSNSGSPGSGSDPQVATDATGDSVLTWVQEDGIDGDGDIVQARTLSSGGSLGSIVDLSAAGRRAFAPQVATDADGDSIFTWLRFDGVRDRVQARTMTAGGVLGTTVNLTTSGPSALDPQVATDTDGDSVFAWERFESLNDRVQARRRAADGTLGAITNLSAPGGDGFAPQVASAGSGASVFVWLRFDGTVDRVQARAMNAAGSFGSTFDLSVAGTDAETPQVAVAANNGKAFATWTRGGIVQAAIGP